MDDNALSPAHCHLISSFTGELCQGNQHLIFVEYVTNSPHLHLTENSYSERYASVSVTLSPYIVVFLHIANDGKSASARFFHHGYEVLRCGSGTIAIAYVLLNLLADNLTSNKKSVVLSHFATRFGDTRIGQKKNTLFYETPVLPLSLYKKATRNKASRKKTDDNQAVCKQKRAWTSVINKPIKGLALVGGKRDYCILELYDKKAVKQCIINVSQLMRFSARAVIVTAIGNHWRNDYVIRYFTPQYGQYEDRATGSANAMLATYWQAKLTKTKIRGQQLSNAGGLLWVEKCGNKQRVFGDAKKQTIPADIVNKIMFEVNEKS